MMHDDPNYRALMEPAPDREEVDRYNHKMSPARLKLAMHFYYSPAPFEEYEASKDIAEFCRLGILRAAAGLKAGFEMTPLGIAWIDLILSTPFPIPGFFDPRDGSPIKR